jgi:flagellar FliL protein
MAAEEANESTKESSAPESGGGGNKLVLILTALNLAISLGVAGVVFIAFKKEANQPKVGDIVANEPHAEPKKEGDGQGGTEQGAGAKPASASDLARVFKVELAMFTVNLQSPGSANPRFARVNLTIEVSSEDTEKEVNQKMPQVRNTVIDLINSKTPADVKEVEGKNHLKEQIQKALNAFLVTGKVKGVYFTSFVVNS